MQRLRIKIINKRQTHNLITAVVSILRELKHHFQGSKHSVRKLFSIGSMILDAAMISIVPYLHIIKGEVII